jgi:endonuclease V-like protein UPF0215 family
MRAFRALESLVDIVLLNGGWLAGFNVVWMQCMLMSERRERVGAALI